MARKSKKGACSANTQKAKRNALEHDRRNEESKRVPGYVNQHRSHLNRVIFEDDMVAGRKHLQPLIDKAFKLYEEKVKQTRQEKFAPFKESVLHINDSVTDEQLLKFARREEKLTGWKLIGVYRHEDEGYVHSRYIEGDENFAINHHAHVLWYCQNTETGKAIRLKNKGVLSRMQDDLAEETGMERGYKASETGIKHRSAMQYRIDKQQERIDELQKRINDIEEEKDFEIERLQRQVDMKTNELNNLNNKKEIAENEIDDLQRRGKIATQIAGRSYDSEVDRIADMIVRYEVRQGRGSGWRPEPDERVAVINIPRQQGRWHQNNSEDDIKNAFTDSALSLIKSTQNNEVARMHFQTFASAIAIQCISRLSADGLSDADKLLAQGVENATERNSERLRAQEQQEDGLADNRNNDEEQSRGWHIGL